MMGSYFRSQTFCPIGCDVIARCTGKQSNKEQHVDRRAVKQVVQAQLGRRAIPRLAEVATHIRELWQVAAERMRSQKGVLFSTVRAQDLAPADLRSMSIRGWDAYAHARHHLSAQNLFLYDLCRKRLQCC